MGPNYNHGLAAKGILKISAVIGDTVILKSDFDHCILNATQHDRSARVGIKAPLTVPRPFSLCQASLRDEFHSVSIQG
jgi:hypothetical protein